MRPNQTAAAESFAAASSLLVCQFIRLFRDVSILAQVE